MNSTAMTLLEEANRLQRGGAHAEAAAKYGELLRADPENVDALCHLARIDCQQGRLAEGADLLRRALTIDPKRATLHNLLGMARARLGQLADALASLDAAIACDPNLVEAHGNRGDVLVELGRQVEAIDTYDRALALKPNSIDNWCNRGAALHDLHRYREAVESFDRVIALRPDFAQVHLNRAGALARLGRLVEAVDGYDRALASDPGNADALASRSAVLAKLKRYGEAITSAERALELAPKHPRAAGELAANALAICDWSKIGQLRSDFFDRVANGKMIVSPFVVLGLSDDPKLLLECARHYTANEIPKSAPLPRRLVPRPDARIRVAYLSADFRRHATAYLMARLFELHDRSRFEIIGVSFGADDKSDTRARLERAFDRFVDVSEQSDREVAAVLHAMEVDIAVDLKGHTEGARLGILAHRPAPIQVSYLGYPGTTGADFVDYVIADDVVLPFRQQAAFSERIVQLPDCYQVNDSTREVSPRLPSRTELGLPERAFVFCCFNHAWKINGRMFDIWMRLLQGVPDSVLWLFRSNEAASDKLRQAAQARGVSPDRLIFARFLEQPEHLARLQQADLFLDTLPYNAHTTASDALWAGVPVLTCAGQSFAGRVGASILRAAGFPELVTDDLAAYEARALALASDPAQLQALRRRLAETRASCPLFDTDRFRRHIEAAYGAMYEIWKGGERPRGFRIDPIEA